MKAATNELFGALSSKILNSWAKTLVNLVWLKTCLQIIYIIEYVLFLVENTLSSIYFRQEEFNGW